MSIIDFPYELGIGQKGKYILLYYRLQNRVKHKFYAVASIDGVSFKDPPKGAAIAHDSQRKEDPERCSDFRISKLKKFYFLTYKLRAKKHTYLCGASSTDLIHWEKIAHITNIKEVGVVVPRYKHKKKYVMYFGGKEIKVATSTNLNAWEALEQPILEKRQGYFDDSTIEPAGAFLTEQYILLVYYAKKKLAGKSVYSVGAALLYKEDPTILLWRSDEPLWTQDSGWKSTFIRPLGVALLPQKLIVYWKVGRRGVYAVSCTPPIHIARSTGKISSLILKKYHKNPIITPISKNYWESKATFNPAAVYEAGKVHLVYRAIGDKDISVLGYAQSSDGIHIDERLSEPIYTPTQPFECPDENPMHLSLLYVSGGGYGGCEDPRITKIDGRFYMTYVAHNGNNPPRVALTSIAVEDFLNRNWRWDTPKLISRPGVVDKNASILPEKVSGKYVVFHRIFPNILIDFVDDLHFHEYLKDEYSISPSRNSWDSLKLGVGAPPIKTKDGWLLIYQGVGHQDSSRYKIGAMLLDLSDPTRELYRSQTPILEPTEYYENEGLKYGVVYPCGAVVLKNQLIVYYGGADMVVCAATCDLDSLLTKLKYHQPAQLNPVTSRVKIASVQ